jgi:hypothetical protein
MANMSNVLLKDLGKGKFEFRYTVLSNSLLATAEEITTELKGELFDGYIVVPGWDNNREITRLFGINIHLPDVIYRVRTVNIAMTRLLGDHIRESFKRKKGNARFIKGLYIHTKISARGLERRVYRSGQTAIYPSGWSDRLSERVGKELLPWYLGNRTRYFR